MLFETNEHLKWKAHTQRQHFPAEDCRPSTALWSLGPRRISWCYRYILESPNTSENHPRVEEESKLKPNRTKSPFKTSPQKALKKTHRYAHHMHQTTPTTPSCPLQAPAPERELRGPPERAGGSGCLGGWVVWGASCRDHVQKGLVCW